MLESLLKLPVIEFIMCMAMHLLSHIINYDRIFRTKLGLSKSLMVHEGTANLNVTQKGYPKKFWGLFGQKPHKTHQVIPFHPKRGGLSLTLMDQGQTYNPKCHPKWYE